MGDGWGTLKTPAGTFANVLLIKRIQTHRDSAVTGGTAAITDFRSVSYVWSDAAHPAPLLSTSTGTSTPQGGSASTTNNSSYNGNQTLSILQQSASAITWSISPNPAKGHLQLTLNLNTQSTLSISLVDINGRVAMRMAPTSYPAGINKATLDVAALPAGVYVMRMQTTEGQESRLIVIQ
jgi:hypothetical protein